MGFFYDTAKKGFLDGLHNVGQTYKFMLVNSSYTPSQSHEFVSSALAGEYSTTGTGYARTVATGMVSAIDAAAHRAYINCDDPTWAALNVSSIVAAILIREVGLDAANYLIAYLDLPAPATPGGGQFSILIPNGPPPGWGYL